MDKVVISASKLTALGDAVRNRFGVSGELTLDEMATIIAPYLPDTFQQVDYIQSSGNQYINTGISDADSAEIVFEAASARNGLGVFGNKKSNNSIRMGIYYWDGMYVWQNNNVNTEIANFQTEAKYKVQIGSDYGNKIIINDIEVASQINSTSNGPMLLFAVSTDNSAYPETNSYKLNGKIYSFKAKVNGKAYDFVPCYRKSDNVIGMYDIINSTFYTNQGSGSFSCYPAPPSN